MLNHDLGTFEPEPKEEALAYGLVHPIRTFDEVSVQVRYYSWCFRVQDWVDWCIYIRIYPSAQEDNVDE